MNAGKTCFTLLGTQNSIDRASGFALKVNDVDIRPAKHIKVLGVLLDQTLSWETHISSIVRRTNAILVSLYKIRHHLSPEILTILVQAHVFPTFSTARQSGVVLPTPVWTDCRGLYTLRHGWSLASASMITSAPPSLRSAGLV